MKLPESAAFKLFDHHGISHPKIIDMRLPRSLQSLAMTSRVVVKADLAIGGKKKAGLVQICDFTETEKVMKKMGVRMIVEEFIEHRDEYFVAIKAVREGIEIYYSGMGGIEIESNWEKVSKIEIGTEILINEDWSKVEDKLFNFVAEKNVREWIVELIKFFQDEDVTYFEVNPFTIVDRKILPLGVVLVLDESASFRHSNWPEVDEDAKTEREKKVAEVDSQIKGSIKLVEVASGGNTAMMGGGAGSALFLCDAILENGLTLANYAEFSGNPPDFAVSELTRQVCAIPGIKNLVVGSGIANFTPVVGNMKGIIAGLKESSAAKKLNIVVRRCGPGEDAGIKLMKEFAKESGLKIQVFGRETGMTEIVARLRGLN